MPPDSPLVDFGACSCGKAPVAPSRLRPEWAAMSGYEGGLSIRSGAVPEGGPAVGSRLPVHLSYPFTQRLGEPFWFLAPTEIDVADALASDALRMVEACLVDARPREAAGARAGRVNPGRDGRIHVLAVATLDDLLALPPQSGTLDNALGGWGPGFVHERWRDLRLSSASFEGDISIWVLWREIDGVGHLLLAGETDVHRSVVHAGHRVLTDDERLALQEGRTCRPAP